MKLDAVRAVARIVVSVSGYSRVERRNARLDLGFKQARYAQIARPEALARFRNSRETRLHFGFHQRAQLLRHARKQDHDSPLRLDPLAGRGAARIREHRRAFDYQRLPRVDFRHGAAEAPEPFLDFSQGGFVGVDLAPEEVRDGLPRAVIVGRAEAADETITSARSIACWKDDRISSGASPTTAL